MNRNIIISIFCGVIAAVLRFLDFKNNFDGVFVNNSYLSLIALIICGLAFIFNIYDLVFKQNVITSIISHKGKIQSLSSCLTGIICITSASFMYFDFINPEKTTTSVTGISLQKPFLIITFVLGIYLIVCGIFHQKASDEFFKNNPALELIPLIFCIINLMYVYIYHSVSVIKTENIFVLVACSAVLLAVLYKSKFIAEIEKKKTAYRKSLLFCCLSLSLSLACFASSLLLFFVNKEEITGFPMTIQVINFSLSLNILVFLTHANKKNCKSRINSSIKTHRYR